MIILMGLSVRCPKPGLFFVFSIYVFAFLCIYTQFLQAHDDGRLASSHEEGYLGDALTLPV